MRLVHAKMEPLSFKRVKSKYREYIFEAAFHWPKI